ncbi:hypothetical protein HDV01_006717 [Terramyces sp. JEL0728]|nr:hypothetical protein HDV01_006717 [Terramyces sp. JEL0728]
MDFDISKLIEALHDPNTQKRAAASIFDNPLTADVIPSEFNFTVDQIGLLIGILKTGSMQAVKAAMLLLNLVVDIACGFQSGRMDMIVSGGLLQQIIDNSVPMLLVQKEKSLEMGIVYLSFLLSVLKSNETVARKIINAETPLYSTLTAILGASDGDSRLHELSCKCIKSVSEYQSLRSFLRISQTHSTLLAFLQSEATKTDAMIFYICKGLANIMVHNEESKLHLLQSGIVEVLIELLPNHSSLILKLFAHLLPETDTDLNEKENKELLQMMKLILALMKESKDKALINECLFPLSRYSKYPSVLQLVDLFDWLVELHEQTELSLFILATMTFHDKNESLKKHYKNLIRILWKSISNEELAANALAVLVNLAFNDKESQKICSDIDQDLFPQLFKLSEHQSESIAKTSLQCIRNLCIDGLACTTILQVGLSRMFETIKQRKPDLRVETMQIVRNIFTISPDCFDKVYRQTCFIPEIISCLSQTSDLQRCALDIIEFLVDQQHDNYMVLLLEFGVLGALLDLISKNSAYRKTASKLFTALKSFRTKFLDCDIWKQLLRQWDDDDKRYGRKRVIAKPKKKIKKKK